MFVYLIGSSEGYCKIGISDKPQFRLWGLDSTRLPFELELNAVYDAGDAAHFIERALHKHFAAKCLRGEWFRSVKTSLFLKKAAEFHGEWVPKPKREPEQHKPKLNAVMEDNLMCERLRLYAEQLMEER